ncbi:hypothetical protein OKW50_005197 [Paraburkholderia youngii]
MNDTFTSIPGCAFLNSSTTCCHTARWLAPLNAMFIASVLACAVLTTVVPAATVASASATRILRGFSFILTVSFIPWFLRRCRFCFE